MGLIASQSSDDILANFSDMYKARRFSDSG